MLIHIHIPDIRPASLTLAFPRADVYPLAWVALVPLFFLLGDGEGGGRRSLAVSSSGSGSSAACSLDRRSSARCRGCLLDIFQALFIAAFALSARDWSPDASADGAG